MRADAAKNGPDLPAAQAYQEAAVKESTATVALAGVYTHQAVDSTARYADGCGFVMKVLEDCCASPDPELHRIECEKILPLFGTVISSAEFVASL